MSRPRLLLDTNVLVSAVLFGGVPGELVERVRRSEITGVVSLHILGEFRDVLTRPRFGVEPATADLLIEELVAVFVVSPIEASGQGWSIDPDDDPVIAAALDTATPVVVTGDAHLLGCVVPGLVFRTPAQALALIDPAEGG